jgi:hypothetical protein
MHPACMSACCCCCIFTPALPGQRHCADCLPGWQAAHRQASGARSAQAGGTLQALLDAAAGREPDETLMRLHQRPAVTGDAAPDAQLASLFRSAGKRTSLIQLR